MPTEICLLVNRPVRLSDPETHPAWGLAEVLHADVLSSGDQFKLTAFILNDESVAEESLFLNIHNKNETKLGPGRCLA